MVHYTAIHNSKRFRVSIFFVSACRLNFYFSNKVTVIVFRNFIYYNAHILDVLKTNLCIKYIEIFQYAFQYFLVHI